MSNRKIYKEIAKKHGVSVKEVKRDMQAAINYTYKNTLNDNNIRKAQDGVPRVGEIPTVDEVIRYAVNEIGKEKQV